jgi:hypothetical protein
LRAAAPAAGGTGAEPQLKLLTKHVVVPATTSAPQPARAVGAPARRGAAVTGITHPSRQDRRRQPARRRRLGVPAGAVHGGALAHVAVRMHGIQIAYALGASGAPTPSWRSSAGA